MTVEFTVDLIKKGGNAMIDNKPRFTVSPDGKFVNDSDFGYDALLFIGGDFIDDDERRTYAQAIADVLNEASIPRRSEEGEKS